MQFQLYRRGSVFLSLLAGLNFLLLVLPAVRAGAAEMVKVNPTRTAFYRGETPWIPVEVKLDTAVKGDARLIATLDGLAATEVALGEVSPGTRMSGVRISTSQFRCADYQLKVELLVDAKPLAAGSCDLTIAARPNAGRMPMWLWPHKASLDAAKTFDGESQSKADFWAGLGFNNLAFGESPTPVLSSWFDYAMKRGLTVCLMPPGGFSIPPDADAKDADLLFKGPNGQVIRDGKFANPFHPAVMRHQDKLMAELMSAVRDYPQCTTAFFNTEIVDLLEQNGNEAGSRMLKEELGVTATAPGPPRLVQSGVLADDDPGYLYHKFVFKKGNGFSAANQRVAETIGKTRPDILTINDPYRAWALLDGFPGLGVIGTWTYVNPDPKLMLYVEVLRAAAKPTGQETLHTVTLLNYPGELAPTDRWMMMDEGRLKVTTWINLSRAPRILGYYFSSGCDPFGALGEDLKTRIEVDDFEVPKAGFDTLRALSRQVIEPFGPMIRKLSVPQRRVAVLSSEAARLYGKSPTLLGSYNNMQVMHFYSLLAMAQIPADIVFDETIERFGLDGYDMLVLPKCDVLTESVYRKITEFEKRGGIVVADQYLGADLPNAIRFDFDFTYRDKVTAMAINKNQAYAKWNDQLKPGSAELREVKGVTALDDQHIMESYAKQLREKLDAVISREVDCDAPTALVSRLEGQGADYLVVVNDKREYGPRLGKYRAVLETVVPQQVTLTLNHWKGGKVFAYDLLGRKPIEVDLSSGTPKITVELGDIGGTILAVQRAETKAIAIRAPKTVYRGEASSILVELEDGSGAPISGIQPMQIVFSDPAGRNHELTGYYGADAGALTLPFIPALNDQPGNWTLKAAHLASGLSAEATIELKSPDGK